MSGSQNVVPRSHLHPETSLPVFVTNNFGILSPAWSPNRGEKNTNTHRPPVSPVLISLSSLCEIRINEAIKVHLSSQGSLTATYLSLSSSHPRTSFTLAFQHTPVMNSDLSAELFFKTKYPSIIKGYIVIYVIWCSIYLYTYTLIIH